LLHNQDLFRNKKLFRNKSCFVTSGLRKDFSLKQGMNSRITLDRTQKITSQQSELKGCFNATKTWFDRTLESERVLSLISREVVGRKKYYNTDVLRNTFKTCNEVLQVPKPESICDYSPNATPSFNLTKNRCFNVVTQTQSTNIQMFYNTLMQCRSLITIYDPNCGTSEYGKPRYIHKSKS
jgi:hypothetical protein